ncbi:hypothetical protein KKD61_05105 [Patescibacteria group bacterium]|nr:hypothetical protein [Patescibacteria group bacterium]
MSFDNYSGFRGQFGAVRPPWAKKHLFYRLPFNYCDRYCESCQLRDSCRVYRTDLERQEKALKQGKDPNSLETTLEIVGESFKELADLIKTDAERLEIDLGKLGEVDLSNEPDPEEFLFYQQVKKFANRLDCLVKNFEIIPAEADEDLLEQNLEIIIYFKNLVLGKTFRAFSSRVEEELDPEDLSHDSLTSAFIAVRGFLAIADSIAALSKDPSLRPLKKELVNVISLAFDLVEAIELEFDIGDFFGKES